MDGRLAARLALAVERYPCHAILVHRDAEGASREERVEEIRAASEALRDRALPHVPVVPVRMTEAWLLVDEDAIRRASDNPGGRIRLELPALGSLERLADAKDCLNSSIVEASETSGRRRKKISRPTELSWRRVRVAELIGDYSVLRALVAFRHLEDDARSISEHIVGNLQEAR
jgi:hypothetical protein